MAHPSPAPCPDARAKGRLCLMTGCRGSERNLWRPRNHDCRMTTRPDPIPFAGSGRFRFGVVSPRLPVGCSGFPRRRVLVQWHTRHRRGWGNVLRLPSGCRPARSAPEQGKAPTSSPNACTKPTGPGKGHAPSGLHPREERRGDNGNGSLPVETSLSGPDTPRSGSILDPVAGQPLTHDHSLTT